VNIDIKTVDVSECLVNCVPNIKYSVAFCEASGPCLVRHAGNDGSLELLATEAETDIEDRKQLLRKIGYKI
jgi:uncharacterized protein